MSTSSPPWKANLRKTGTRNPSSSSPSLASNGGPASPWGVKLKQTNRPNDSSLPLSNDVAPMSPPSSTATNEIWNMMQRLKKVDASMKNNNNNSSLPLTSTSSSNNNNNNAKDSSSASSDLLVSFKSKLRSVGVLPRQRFTPNATTELKSIQSSLKKTQPKIIEQAILKPPQQTQFESDLDRLDRVIQNPQSVPEPATELYEISNGLQRTNQHILDNSNGNPQAESSTNFLKDAISRLRKVSNTVRDDEAQEWDNVYKKLQTNGASKSEFESVLASLRKTTPNAKSFPSETTFDISLKRVSLTDKETAPDEEPNKIQLRKVQQDNASSGEHNESFQLRAVTPRPSHSNQETDADYATTAILLSAIQQLKKVSMSTHIADHVADIVANLPVTPFRSHLRDDATVELSPEELQLEEMLPDEHEEVALAIENIESLKLPQAELDSLANVISDMGDDEEYYGEAYVVEQSVKSGKSKSTNKSYTNEEYELDEDEDDDEEDDDDDDDEDDDDDDYTDSESDDEFPVEEVVISEKDAKEFADLNQLPKHLQKELKKKKKKQKLKKKKKSRKNADASSVMPVTADFSDPIDKEWKEFVEKDDDNEKDGVGKSKRHRWKHKKHWNSVLGDRRYRVEKGATVYSVLSPEQKQRRKTVGRSILKTIEDMGGSDVLEDLTKNHQRRQTIAAAGSATAAAAAEAAATKSASSPTKRVSNTT